MIWKCKNYSSLSIDELYQILRIRQEVFVIEQDCNYLDADNLDKDSDHLLCYKQDVLIAYMRIYINPNNVNKLSFGRILVRKRFRGMGLGKELVQRGIDLNSDSLKNRVISMSAQVYLIKFYEELGFKIIGEQYLEDQIPHVKMIRVENGKDML